MHPLSLPPREQPSRSTPGDTYVNVTGEFVDTCNKDKLTKITIQALVRQCQQNGTAQNPLLQPWQADSVKIVVQPLPANCESAGQAVEACMLDAAADCLDSMQWLRPACMA